MESSLAQQGAGPGRPRLLPRAAEVGAAQTSPPAAASKCRTGVQLLSNPTPKPPSSRSSLTTPKSGYWMHSHWAGPRRRNQFTGGLEGCHHRVPLRELYSRLGIHRRNRSHLYLELLPAIDGGVRRPHSLAKAIAGQHHSSHRYGISVDDLIALVAVATGVSFGIQGLGASDIASYPNCSGDWCNLFAKNPKSSIRELQSFAQSFPSNTTCTSTTSCEHWAARSSHSVRNIAWS